MTAERNVRSEAQWPASEVVSGKSMNIMERLTRDYYFAMLNGTKCLMVRQLPCEKNIGVDALEYRASYPIDQSPFQQH
jgi:hypothetical protein